MSEEIPFEPIMLNPETLMMMGWEVSAGNAIRIGSAETDSLVAITFKGHRNGDPTDIISHNMCVKLEWFEDFLKGAADVVANYKKVMGL